MKNETSHSSLGLSLFSCCVRVLRSTTLSSVCVCVCALQAGHSFSDWTLAADSSSNLYCSLFCINERTVEFSLFFLFGSDCWLPLAHLPIVSWPLSASISFLPFFIMIRSRTSFMIALQRSARCGHPFSLYYTSI